MMFLFFFSSRRRHTRLQGDWSSDVCSSDLGTGEAVPAEGAGPSTRTSMERWIDPGSEERRVGKSVDLGGRRIIKKKKTANLTTAQAAAMQNAMLRGTATAAI